MEVGRFPFQIRLCTGKLFVNFDVAQKVIVLTFPFMLILSSGFWLGDIYFQLIKALRPPPINVSG